MGHRHGQQAPGGAGAQHTHAGHTRLGIIRTSPLRGKKDSPKEKHKGSIVKLKKRLVYHRVALDLLDMEGLEREPKQVQERKGR